MQMTIVINSFKIEILKDDLIKKQDKKYIEVCKTLGYSIC